MVRLRLSPAARSLVGAMALVAASSQSAPAQPRPLQLPKGTRHSVKIDSSPQQAAIYVNSKEHGIQGYTPSTLRLPSGTYRFVIELPGFKPIESTVEITRSQAFTVALERMPRPAILDLRAGNDQNALGATIVVDGTTVGSLPNQVEVAAGSHLVEVHKPGFAVDRENVQVGEGERRTLVIAMASLAKPGGIIVMSDTVNAEVWVDGARRDTTPALVNDLAEGPHTVEVRKEGLQPWKQVVNVPGGQQVKVTATLAPQAPPPPAAGSIKVLSGTAMADVLLDGEPKGPAGSEIRDVRPGSHIVEVRAPGFAAKRAEVQVAAGEMRVIEVDLAPEGRRGAAGLRVISAEPEVDVFLDGAPVGRAPIERSDLAAGKHFVVAHKAGYGEYKAEVVLEPEKTSEIAVDLRAAGTLRMITNPAGADVVLDGNPVGRTPLTLTDVPTGDHVVELKLQDYVAAKETVRVEGGSQRIVQADLVATSHGPSAQDLERSQREQSSFGATTVDRGRVNVDLGAGFAYFFQARLITGILRFASVGQGGGLDLGIDFRMNYFENSVGLRPRVQILRVDPFALGVDMLFSGGGGPNRRNSFTYELGPIVTLIAGSYVHVSFRPYLVVSTDRLCPSVNDLQDSDSQSATMKTGSGDLYLNEAAACKQYDTTRNMANAMGYQLPDPTKVQMGQTMPYLQPGQMFNIGGQADPRERFVTTRFMLQATVEISINRYLSAWGMIEGAPGQGQRQSFTGKFNSGLPTNDFPLYGRAGITLKF